MKKLILLIIAAFVLTGCATLGKLPSVCDNLQEPSYLCKISGDSIRLEDVSNMLLIVNAVSIGEGLYTKEQAISILEHLKQVLDNPVSYAFFASDVLGKVEKYPGLLEVAKIYFDQLATNTQVMFAADRRFILYQLEKQLDILGE